MVKRVTLKDIARESGFSVMTVSRALNDDKSNHASPQNRELIQQIARRLNYQPNLNARRLVTRRTDVIGLLEDIQAPSFRFGVIQELERLITHAGYRLQIALFHDDIKSMSQYIRDFQGNGINSVYCLAHSYPEFGDQVPAMLDRFARVVFLEKPRPKTRFSFISPDHYHNYFSIATQMLKAGRRRIISVRWNYRDNAFHEARRGLQDAYAQAGVPWEECFWAAMPTDGMSDEDAMTNLEAVLPSNPDALILSNDDVVLRTVSILDERGIRVPEDMALFSAMLTRFGGIARPRISGIDYNAPLLARHLFQKMFPADKNAASPAGIFVPSDLVWRETCPCR